MIDMMKEYLQDLKNLIWAPRADLDSYFQAEFKNNAEAAKDYFMCTQRMNFAE